MMRNEINILKSLFLLSFMMVGMIAFAQTTKKRPDTVTSFKVSNLNVTTNNSGVDDVGYAIDNSETTYARINSYSGILTLAGYRSNLQLNYSNSLDYVPVNSKFYLKVNSNESGLLNGLLGGSVGNLLKGVLGIVIGGNHVTEFHLKNAADANVISVSTTNVASNQDKVNFAVDKTGTNYYGIFYPTQPIKTINIQDRTDFSILGLSNYFDVYDAFYYENVSRCDVPLLTSYTINSEQVLSVLSSIPVIDAHKAIDDDLESYSSIGISSLLSLGVGNEIEQFVHLPKAINDKITRFIVQIPSGLLSVPIGQESSIIFYKDNIPVGTVKLDNNLIGLDLLGLVNQNNMKVSFSAVPKDNLGNIIPFDKIGIRIKKGVDVNLANAEDIRVYDVALISDKPKIEKVCTKEFITQVNGVDIREIKFDIRDIIPNYNSSNAYTISNVDEVLINPHTNYWQPLGSYVIKGITNSSVYCPQDNVSFKAIQDTQYRISGRLSISIPLDANGDGNADAQHIFSAIDYGVIDFNNTNANVTADYSTIQVFRENDNENITGQAINFSQIGTYNFYVKTSNIADPDCELVRRVTVYIYDKAECNYTYQRLGANFEKSETTPLLLIPLGGSSNSASSIDSAQQEIPTLKYYDLSTHGSIFNVISLLGIGTTSQDLMFKTGTTITASSPNKQIPAGTPLTVKLGQDYSVLQVLGGITLQPLNTFGNPDGPLLSVDEFDLANVLVGDNVFEYTFIPRNSSGDAIHYSGVRIYLGSVLGLGNTLKIYGAYIDERIPIETVECNPNIVVNGAETRVRDVDGNFNTTLDTRLLLNRSTSDVLWGTKDIGLGVATLLSSILYPYQAVDAIEAPGTELHGAPNLETGATFNASVGALNAMTLTVKLKEIARPGDKIRIILGHQGGTVLDVNVLGSALTAQRYMGDVAIGDPVTIDANSLIDLDLLALINPQTTGKYAYILEEIGAPFDRVQLQIGNIVNAQLLAPKLVVYDVSMLPYFEFESLEETTRLCTSVPFEIEKMDPCTSYDISFSYPTIVNGEITAWNHIVGSEIHVANENSDRVQYRLQMKNLLKVYNDNETLYMKVITKRQGCIYGDAQYLKVKLASCSAISNPMIRTRLKSE